MRKVPALLVACLLAAGVYYLARGGTAPPTPVEPGDREVVFRIDRIEITKGELEEHAAFLEEVGGDRSPAQIRRFLLSDLLLPRRIAESLIPEENRREAREKAEALAAVVAAKGGRLAALREEGARFGGGEAPRPFTPTSGLPADALEILFSLEIGAVSPPLELRWGCLILSPISEKKGLDLRSTERRAYTVFFPNGATEALKAEADDILRDLLRNGRPWIHPYYEDALSPLFPSL